MRCAKSIHCFSKLPHCFGNIVDSGNHWTTHKDIRARFAKLCKIFLNSFVAATGVLFMLHGVRMFKVHQPEIADRQYFFQISIGYIECAFHGNMNSAVFT